MFFMYRYQVVLESKSLPYTGRDLDRFLAVEREYNPLVSGNDNAGTCTLFFASDCRVTRSQIQKKFGSIKVIGFGRKDVRDAA